MFEDVDTDLRREVRYREVVRMLEEMIHAKIPWPLPKPEKLAHNDVVKIARMLAACHED